MRILCRQNLQKIWFLYFRLSGRIDFTYLFDYSIQKMFLFYLLIAFIFVLSYNTSILIYLPGESGGRTFTLFEPVRKVVIIMYVTWNELFVFVAMLTGIITLVVEIHKNSRPVL